MTDIQVLRDERESLKDQLELIKVKLDRVNQAIKDALSSRKGESFVLDNGNQIKVVRGFSRKYDWSGLEKELPGAVWDMILEPSQKRLDELIADGVVSPRIVAKNSSRTEREAFIREFNK